jgi:hypothetical protein
MKTKIITYSLAIYLCLGFNSCKEINSNLKDVFPMTIFVDSDKAGTDSIRLSKIAIKIEYIPLQTTDSILLDYIYHFKITNDFIYIENGLDLLRFSTNGKFINVVYSAGRGPGETLPVCSAIDEENKRVFVFDRDKTIKIYKTNGDYLSVIKELINPVESLPPWKIEYFENNLFVALPQRPGVEHIYSLFNLKTDSIIPIFKNKYQYTNDQKSKQPSIISWDYCYQVFDTALMFKERFCDTVFILNRKLEVRPRFILNIAHKLEWETWRDKGMFNIGAGPPEGFWVHSIAESKDFLFLILSSYKRPKIFVIYDKGSRKVELSTIPDFNSYGSQVYLKNDLDHLVDFPVFNKSEGYIFYYDECLYSVIEAKYFKEAYSRATEKDKNSSEYLRSMESVLSSITEFSNPIIMKITLKQNAIKGLFERSNKHN